MSCFRSKKLELLEQIAPHSLLLYGHGSEESISVYNSCKKLKPGLSPTKVEDEQSAYLLAGMCANFCGRQMFELSTNIAMKVCSSALANQNSRILAIGLTSIIPSLYAMGQFDEMFTRFAHLKQVFLSATCFKRPAYSFCKQYFAAVCVCVCTRESVCAYLLCYPAKVCQNVCVYVRHGIFPARECSAIMLCIIF